MEEGTHPPRRTAIILLLLASLFGGATFYHYAEGWRYLDALYFSAYTMTTVGYGDITPKTDLGKGFTIFYVFSGVGIAIYGLSVLASDFVERRERFILEKVGIVQLHHHTRSFLGKLKGVLPSKWNLMPNKKAGFGEGKKKI